MRNKCPVCDSDNKINDWELCFVVPDNWSIPIKSTVCYCKNCDMIWYDNDKTQEDYDNYYINKYGYDGALNNAESFARMDELVDIIIGLNLPKSAKIVDFGGGFAKHIEHRMVDLGYTNVFTIDAGDSIPKGIDMLIAAEVFEHIYDIQGVLTNLVNSMSPDGLFLIELPDAERMTLAKGQMLLDYHQKHVNHFPPYTLDRLFQQFGYFPRFQDRKLEAWHFGHIYRAIYGPKYNTYELSKKLVTESVEEHINRLQKIDFPVVVWGCSDVCLYLLEKVKLNVIHFVDMDPAYRGETIQGLPVLDHVESDVPIVVMAYNQRSAIVKNIKDLGLKNEVIII